MGIPSMAVLDHWCNYGIRFSSLTTQELAQFNQQCDVLPDYVCVMDEFARQEMANDGVPYERIRVLGNPHFETLLIKTGVAPDVRKQFAHDDELLVTFASESNLEDNGYGDEKTAVAHLIEVLQHAAALQGKKVVLVIRLHPKEAMEKYAEYLDRPGIILDKTTDGIALLMASDVVVSVSSMFLIEAVILGKPVISYQPSARNPDNFILTKSKTIPFIHTLDGLVKEINTVMNLNAFSGYDHGINMKATDSIVNFIESVL
jgi:UDP-N-acetylglucosamine 2-epimerase